MGKPFKITGIAVLGYEFGIVTKPYEQGPWEGAAITLAFKDALPLGTLRRCFATREIVGMRCDRAVEGLGALHGLSHQFPA